MNQDDRDNNEPTDLIFADAPEEFRIQAIALMVEKLGWQKIRSVTFAVHEARAESKVSWAVTKWSLLECIGHGPLMSCPWWMFMLILEEISTISSRDAIAVHEQVMAQFGVELGATHRSRYRKAQQIESEFQSRLNDLFESFRLGYRLIDGELVRRGLEDVAAWRVKALAAVDYEPIREVIDSTWNALNALDEPDLRAAFIGAGMLFFYLKEEFEALLESDKIPEERRELAKALSWELDDGYWISARPFDVDLDDIHVDHWIGEAFSLVVKIYDMPEVQEQIDYRSASGDTIRNPRRRIR